MRFTDPFIRRPVLAIVVSLLILLMGLRSIQDMQVRQYPELSNTVITVTTTYAGADAALMQGFVTDPIQAAVAKVNGVDYITSKSSANMSVVTARIRLNFDPNAAMTDVMAQVAAAKGDLPSGADEPVIDKKSGSGISNLYLAFYSSSLTTAQITDYVSRAVKPRLSTVPGVAAVNLLGAQKFAIRIWLDPERMAQQGLSAEAVQAILRANNFQSAAGSLKGYYDTLIIKAQTDISDTSAFENLVVKTTKDGVVRLKDVAQITLGAESTNTTVLANGKEALFVSIDSTPDANPLTVVKGVREVLPAIENDMPPAISLEVSYDSTVFIQESIKEVLKTIAEAAVIVVVVIFLFMGSLRSVIIPIVTIPLSLIGVCVVMLAMGFSINLMTLLAFVLAIGLVVDDAIVVVENVHRHIEEGKTPFHAAIVGAREIATPVISMTITLAAVYAPMAFLGGLTGALFKEFALTLAGAVMVSGVIALTLSPMMCSSLLKAHDDSRMAQLIDKWFTALSDKYEHLLERSLTRRGSTLVLAVVVLATLPVMLHFASSELAPPEDQGIVLTQMTGPATANPEYMKLYGRQVGEIFDAVPEKETYFLVNGSEGVSDGIAGVILKPWAMRDRTEQAISESLQGGLNAVTGLQISAFSLPPLPGSDGLPIQFVVSTTSDYATLFGVMTQLEEAARTSGRFIFQMSDLRFENPEVVVTIDRDRAGKYGVTMQAIGNALATVFGAGEVNRIDLEGRGYKVIPQAERQYRLDPEQITKLHVTAGDGSLVPLASLVTLEQRTRPNSLNQFNQLNSATFAAVPMPGVTMGEALAFLQQKSKEILPEGFAVDYAGPSRQFVKEGSALMLTFVFALVVIYLVLSAQYESFRDPLVIMTSVPLSMVGALIPLALGVLTLNIYTQVGLITLIGLITKHGILICEVAMEEQVKNGKSKTEAVAHAAALRLRPILMTTAAMVAGVIPLTMAAGAGAASRFSIGVVIAGGLTIGTLFTLFVLPVIYTFIADDHRAKELARREREAGLGLGDDETPGPEKAETPSPAH